MPAPEEHPASTETMAFQLLLQKLVSMEHTMQAIPPLLTKIIDQLEAQAKPSAVPVATYAQLYALGQEPAAAPAPALETQAPPAPVPHARGRALWRWFMQETS